MGRRCFSSSLLMWFAPFLTWWMFAMFSWKAEYLTLMSHGFSGKLKFHTLLHRLFLQVMQQFALFAAERKLSSADCCCIISGAIVLNTDHRAVDRGTCSSGSSFALCLRGLHHPHPRLPKTSWRALLPSLMFTGIILDHVQIGEQDETGQEPMGFADCGPQFRVA